MPLNKKGSEEGLSWPVAAIIAVIILFIMYLVFFTNSGIWGKTKAGADKFFEKTESGIKLYNEYFGDNEDKINKETEDIKTLILTNFSVKGDNCLGLLDVTDKEKIEGFSVYFVRNTEKKGTDFYIFEGRWRDDINTAISENKYIKYGFLNKEIIFYYNTERIDEFLLSDNLEYINFVFSGKRESVKLTNPGWVYIYITSGKTGEYFVKDKKVVSYKILNPVFYKSGNIIKVLDVKGALELDKTKNSCSNNAVIEYK